MKPRAARVLLAGLPVGFLEEAGDETRFTYSPEWLARKDARPVSLTLPLRAEAYVSRGLHPFFENLLPEGWLLRLTSKTLKVSESDSLGLLLATCGDCAGAVEIEPLRGESR